MGSFALSSGLASSVSDMMTAMVGWGGPFLALSQAPNSLSRISLAMSPTKAAGSAAARGCAAITANLSATPPRASSVVGSDAVSSQRSHFTSDSNDDSCEGASAMDDDQYFGVWPPNKMTVVYQRMQVECPDIIKAYARCVIDKQNSGALIQNACEDEFRRVRDCFRSVRGG